MTAIEGVTSDISHPLPSFRCQQTKCRLDHTTVILRYPKATNTTALILKASHGLAKHGMPWLPAKSYGTMGYGERYDIQWKVKTFA